MAVLTKAGVTINDWWYEGDRVGSKRKVLDVTLVLVAQGGLTNNIPAALFGLRKITEASNFRTATSAMGIFCASWDGSILVTGITGSDPVDQTDTFRGIVRGKE